jgi:predicted TIM-barrel fold metal-dependent hydrolase
MQPIIKAFPETIFVLLHSSYPYTRDAGYLTSVYKNVYLDFGEIFPFISADGQRTVVHQVLELAPTNKILWSSSSTAYLLPHTLLTVVQLMRRGGRKGSTLPLPKLAR